MGRLDPPSDAELSNEATGSVEASDRSPHLDLLGWAAELQQAALRHDVESVHSQLGTLRQVFLAHMGDEPGRAQDLTIPAANAIRSGQRKLLAQIDALVDSSARETDDCRCIEGTSRLVAGLRRQGRLETGLHRR